ncbi:MAG: SPOR domain-containing protein [Nitrosomonadales bacterium]|nr:SPOR domain-containing protein [Nitrosomonadales bacterium]
MSNGGAGKGKVIAGVFIGMVLGIVAAGAVAWYVMEKRQDSFINKERKPAAAVAPLAVSAPVATAPASGVAETKQHFEFYKVLTDKQDGASRKNAARQKEPAIAKLQPAPPALEAPKEMYYVQAGSFQNADDAEKLKVKLAFSGFEANIQTATIPDKGIWHRVRLGPYNGNEAGKTIAALRQNGIIATQVQAQ